MDHTSQYRLVHDSTHYRYYRLKAMGAVSLLPKARQRPHYLPGEGRDDSRDIGNGCCSDKHSQVVYAGREDVSLPA